MLAEKWELLQKSKKLLDIYKDMKDKNKKKLADRIAWEDSPFDFSEGAAESAANGKE